MVGSHECQDVNELLFLLQLDTVIYLTREHTIDHIDLQHFEVYCQSDQSLGVIWWDDNFQSHNSFEIGGKMATELV